MSRVGWSGESGGVGGAASHTKRKYKGLEMARVRGVGGWGILGYACLGWGGVGKAGGVGRCRPLPLRACRQG